MFNAKSNRYRSTGTSLVVGRFFSTRATAPPTLRLVISARNMRYSDPAEFCTVNTAFGRFTSTRWSWHRCTCFQLSGTETLITRSLPST